MVEKLIFSLQVFILGFSVVLVVLFALYGLTLLFNRFFIPGTKGGPVAEGEDLTGGLSLQAAAAVAAALRYHGTAVSAGTSRGGRDQPPG